MQGFVNIFVNRDSFEGQEEQELLDLFKKYSPETFQKCQEAGYPIMLLTTTNEASRAEKVDFNQPFPRKKPKPGYAYGEDGDEENLETKIDKLCKLLEKSVSKLKEEETDDDTD